MQNTTHYNLKKPDYTDFADIQDINDNMDTIDAELAAPTGDGRDQTVSFTDADLDSGITSFPTFLTKIVSGMKLAKFLRDFKAGMAYVLHVGSLVNNATCTESGKALDARMGKTLQDQITSLNDSLALTRNYVREVTLTGTNLNLSNATAFLHVPVKFRYAIVLCRFVTYDGQGRFFAVACYTNYINTNTITVLDKSPALGEIDFQIGSSDGLPVLLVSVPGYGYTVLQSCEMTLLIRGLQS